MAAAVASRNRELLAAITTDAAPHLDAAAQRAARGAAALMGMNNVYYRFKHLIGKEEYGQLPARLRMMRLKQPATNQLDFELFCLAVSAVNNCQTCVQSHEHVVLEGGMKIEQVHDAVRIASVINAAAVALEMIF